MQYISKKTNTQKRINDTLHFRCISIFIAIESEVTISMIFYYLNSNEYLARISSHGDLISANEINVCDIEATNFKFTFYFRNFTVLSSLVTSLKGADKLSSEQDLSFLQNLLESKEINALVNVHSKVAKVVKDEKIAPLMSNSIQVNWQQNAEWNEFYFWLIFKTWMWSRLR